MPTRQPVVAGRFYPANAGQLKNEVRHWLKAGESAPARDKQPWGFMLPHAGYVFCGDVIGKTLTGVDLPARLVILCPNHTGNGKMLSVWPRGEWLTPLGPVHVDTDLAEDILAQGGGFEPDYRAHMGEHSIEVLLPFLLELAEGTSIVPICVGTQNPEVLGVAGHALAKALKLPRNAGTGIIVSSDMNHYENEVKTLAKDELALAQVCAASPEGLLRVVNMEKISMCGAGAMALALYAARDLGGAEVEVVAHETSGKASGDFNRTVGYAGLRLYTGAA